MNKNAPSNDFRSRKKITLSIIVPMYNEAEGIRIFFERLEAAINRISVKYEVVCVNDGSKDETLKNAIACQSKNPNIKIINFSRNFGKEAASTAGLEHCIGDVAILMDSDLQHPPEVIENFVKKWEEGFDVVYGIREDRADETLIKKMAAHGFYNLINKISKTHIPNDAGDFRLLDRSVINALQKLPEHSRFMKGLFSWVGFKQIGIPFQVEARVAGRSKWNYWKLWDFAIEGIVSFSDLPLRIWSYVGVFIALISIIYAFFIIVQKIIFGIDVPGLATLMTAVFFFSGIQLISLGVIGEYLSRVFMEVKNRPTYIISDIFEASSYSGLKYTTKKSEAIARYQGASATVANHTTS